MKTTFYKLRPLFILQAPGTETHSIDMTDWDATRALVESLGPIDLLVNNAGDSVIAPFLEVKKEDFNM